ncbi:MAG: transcription elongation factor GreA [Mycoplasmataceae bacterium]|jgi:transcription elongation factor GreA|nr:transcription elongation factor GreA [Mycoplasmataceae bacterium]
MEQQNYLLTKEGKQNLEKELKDLIEVQRPNVIKAIQEAREQGDLSENADYAASKERQGEIEKRIKEVQTILDHVEIIKEDKKDQERVRVGSRVTIEDLSMRSDNVTKYDIVGEVEADPINNKISNLSPLAKSIMNKTESTIVEVHQIENPYKIKIKKIESIKR